MTKTKDIKPISKEEAIKEIYQQQIQAPSYVTRPFYGARLLILCLIISLLSGLVAGFFSNTFFGTDFVYQSLPASQQSKEVPDLNFFLSQDEQAYGKILSQLRSQIVGFYKKKAQSENILDSLYYEKDFLGSGVVATSDGWLLTHQQVIADKDFVVITADKKVFEPLKKVTDPLTGVVLVQISAKELSPVKFANLDYLQPTDPLLVVRYSAQNHGSDIVKTAIQRFSYHDQNKGSDFLLSTERIDRYLKIADDFELVYNGGAIFNDKSEVSGLLFESGRDKIRLAIPSYYLKTAVNNFLASASEVIRNNFGVHYLDLSESLGLKDGISEGKNKGALLLGNLDLKIMAVTDGSPAAVSGLKAGDVILKINNEEIDEKNSLTKLIQDYAPGQELTISLVRAGKDMTVKAVLGEL